MREAILDKLNDIEKQAKVEILHAVESGSRAWNFASPDSDYDVRFIYIRPEEEYLRLDATSDVIQWQLDDILDISGWDLKKTLQLLYKSNPTIFEWCSSPIIYKTSARFDIFKSVLPRYFSVKKTMYHYWNMAKGHHDRYFRDGEANLKKYFYVIRALLAAQWALHKGTPPPMRFEELVEAELDEDVKPEVRRLLDMKKSFSEIKRAAVPPILHEYIENHMSTVKIMADKLAEEENDKEDRWKDLNQVFRKLISEKQ